MRILEFLVPDEYNGEKVETFLREKCKVSRKVLTKAKTCEGCLLLNDKFTRTIDKIKTNDIIKIILKEDVSIVPFFKECDTTEQLTEMSDIKIKYNDKDVAVVSKPFNMPTHPCRNHLNDTLANAFASYCVLNKETIGFKAINRLDKDTKGLVVIGKNQYSASVLSSGLEKTYIGITKGDMPCEKGVVNAPIDRIAEFEQQRCVVETGQRSITEYKIIKKHGNYNLVEFNLLTGRTHQIRVHMSHIGFPLVGDILYGGETSLLTHQALQCAKVGFIHPVTKQKIVVCDDISEDFKKIGFNHY